MDNIQQIGLFPICYSTDRSLGKLYGQKPNVEMPAHDLRRHSATYASRNGVPLEITSRVILRHQDLKTTHVYLEISVIRRQYDGWIFYMKYEDQCENSLWSLFTILRNPPTYSINPK